MNNNVPHSTDAELAKKLSAIWSHRMHVLVVALFMLFMVSIFDVSFWQGLVVLLLPILYVFVIVLRQVIEIAPADDK